MTKIDTQTADSTADGRREYRDRVDLLQSRIGLLTGKERLLMTMYVDNGNSFRQMARLAGVNEASIARKIHKITQRLIDGEYITCLRNRQMFSGAELGIAKDYFLNGLSIRKIACKRGWSYYRVRQTLKKIQCLIKQA